MKRDLNTLRLSDFPLKYLISQYNICEKNIYQTTQKYLFETEAFQIHAFF